MKIDVRVKNFGKLRDVKIKLRPFTVIAGANSSGKSFVTKAFYSFFDSIYTDHFSYFYSRNLSLLEDMLKRFVVNVNQPSYKIESIVGDLYSELEQAEMFLNDQLSHTSFTDQSLNVSLFKDNLLKIEEKIKLLSEFTKGKKKYVNTLGLLEAFDYNISQLSDIASNYDGFVSKKISESFTEKLKENFQVQRLSDLKNFDSKDTDDVSFDFESLGKIEFNGERIRFSLTAESIDLFRSLSNIVFIESPVYWKVKQALEETKWKGRRNDRLLGVPGYVYDLLDDVRVKRIVSPDEELITLCCNQIEKRVKGKFTVNAKGDIDFINEKNGKPISIHTMSSGIISMGILSLLISNAIIKKGSYIFIDEPEINLHPTWQKFFLENLFELSKQGVYVVFCSHSPDIMKCMSNLMRKNPELLEANHFGVNQLTEDGNSVAEEDPLEHIDLIADDLSESFQEMYLDGLDSQDDVAD